MIPIEEFAKILRFAAALYPRFDLDERTIQAYYSILNDLAPDMLKAALLDLASQDSPWFPSAGQIRAAAARLIERAERLPSPDEAWRQVLEWATGGEKPDNPLIIEAAIAIGGPRAIGFTAEDRLFAIAAQFRRAYETLCRREREERTMPLLVRRTIASLAKQMQKQLPDDIEGQNHSN